MTRGYWVMRNGKWDAIIGADVTPGIPPAVGVPPSFVGNGTWQAASVANSPSWATGHAVDDIGLMVIHTNNQALGTIPSGWAHITGSPFTLGTPGAAGGIGLNILWKRAASGSEAALSIGDSGDHQIGRILVFRGCVASGNPVEVIGTPATSAGSSAMSIPGLTTISVNSLVVAILAHAIDASSVDGQVDFEANGTLTDFAERTDASATAGRGGGLAIYTGVKAAIGTVGATTGTIRASVAQISVSLALKAAAGGGGPPPPIGAFRTYIGTSGLPLSLWGNDPTPDHYSTESNGVNMVSSGGHIDDLIANGAHSFWRVTGGNNNHGAPGPFQPALWKGMFNDFRSEVEGVSGGLTKLRSAVATGHFRAIQVLDDYSTGGGVNGFANAVTYEELEEICAHVKAAWPWMPCYARGGNLYNKTTATKNGVVRRYQYLDAGFSTFIFRGTNWTADVTAYYTREVADGIACGLGTIAGANILDRGSGADPAWGCRPGYRSDRCGMSPNEIKAAGFAALANPGMVGFNAWQYLSADDTPAYWGLTEIQAALMAVLDQSAGRNDPPLNIRGDLVPA